MQLLRLLCTLSLVYGGSGDKKSPGISDFWTDDYKVFEQIYGKTSDKDLYSDTLPISYSNLDKATRTEATEKKERFIDNQPFIDTYSFGDKYAKIFAKQILDQEEKAAKPPKSYNFLSFGDFKPINQYNDPETYNYLKHLEQYTKDEKVHPPKAVFKPYVDEREKQIYKSIQDIIDAHEANKSGETENNDSNESDEQIKYLTFGNGKGRNKSNLNKKPSSDITKSRCSSGRCRKRGTSGVRVWTGPYVRKITQNRWITG